MRLVILGNGPAAVAAAEAARGLDERCEITLISKESVPFYSPCPLPEYLEGSIPRSLLFLRDEDSYRRQRLTTVFGRAAAGIDAEARRVRFEDGTLDFDRLLIATGSRAVMPPIPGLAETPGVFSFKTLSDADRILARLPGARRAAVIGSGFIGLEAAQALSRRGLKVAVIEALPQVLPQMLDAEMAGRVEERLREHGVEVLTGSPASAVLGGAGGVAAVAAGGAEVPCDLVVCAAGVLPDLSLVAGSGLATATGILVDGRMATSAEGVFAAGDVVEGPDVFGRRRVLPNWPNAVTCGRIAAFNMLGRECHHRGLEAINVVRIFGAPVGSFGSFGSFGARPSESGPGARLLRREEGTLLQKLALFEGRIVGGQFLGDVNRMGIFNEMMKKGVQVGGLEGQLLSPRFGYSRLLAPPALPSPFRGALGKAAR
jgi:nitrite reductase (NADH) large subunit